MNKEYKKRINTAIDYISNNFSNNLTLEEIAGEAHFSKFHFHRIFKAVTKETVSGHIRRIRLEQSANRLLSDSGETITTIAMDCGFASSQNFATAFKKHFKVSPREFRESYSLDKWTALGNERKISDHLVFDTTKNDSKTNLWINLIDMPPYHVAYERLTGPYELRAYDTVFENLVNWAYKKCDISAAIMLGVIWDNPEVTVPDQCRYDVCITVPEKIIPDDGIGVQKIKGGNYVVGHCEVSHYAELEKTYEDIFSSWFPSSNYIPADSASYEIYLNNPENHPRKNMLIDICIPLEKI